MQKLMRYFPEGLGRYSLGEKIGMEVETQFTDKNEKPISVRISQSIIKEFAERFKWKIHTTKGELVTEIISDRGDKILYELGRHNLEISSTPLADDVLIVYVKEILEKLYEVAKRFEAIPLFAPILETDQDLLVIPDERDAVWVALDGREALNLLTRCSSVQFTIDVPLNKAIQCLNQLGASCHRFLLDYPQETLWRQYIERSRARYNPLRYGGPLLFEMGSNNLEDYCRQLTRHDAVVGPRLVPYNEVRNLDIPLFLRSIWWYFRLKRYGPKLCIEVRPLARHADDMFQEQLESVMNILSA